EHGNALKLRAGRLPNRKYHVRLGSVAIERCCVTGRVYGSDFSQVCSNRKLCPGDAFPNHRLSSIGCSSRCNENTTREPTRSSVVSAAAAYGGRNSFSGAGKGRYADSP